MEIEVFCKEKFKEKEYLTEEQLWYQGRKIKIDTDKTDLEHSYFRHTESTNGLAVFMSMIDWEKTFKYWHENYKETAMTHEKLMKLNGERITCRIKSLVAADAKITVLFVDDAKIRVEDDKVYVCQNKRNGDAAKDKLGYEYSWFISSLSVPYETNNRNCVDIKLLFDITKNESNMTRNDIESGMIVKFEDGTTGVVIDTHLGELIQTSNDTYIPLDAYRDDLTCLQPSCNIKEIMEICYGYHICKEHWGDAKTIWKRNTKTEKEIEYEKMQEEMNKLQEKMENFKTEHLTK